MKVYCLPYNIKVSSGLYTTIMKAFFFCSLFLSLNFEEKKYFTTKHLFSSIYLAT